MPKKLSIEVVKHCDNDYRVIFKDGSLVLRKCFLSKESLLEFLHANINTSDVVLF